MSHPQAAAPATPASPRASVVVYEGDGWTVRLAGPEHADAIATLLRTISFGAPLPMVEERGPDPFALRRLGMGLSGLEPWLFLVEREDGSPGGCISVTVVGGRFRAAVRPIGWVSDVRLIPDLRGARVFPAMFRVALEHVRREVPGLDVFGGSLVDHDHLALTPFMHRDKRRFEQPMAQVMALADLYLISLRGRGRARPGRMVQRARSEDLDELAHFLATHQATRRFGEHVTRRWLNHRLSAWPGLRVEDFWVVRGQGARILGCAQVWDPSAVRRFVRHPAGSGMKGRELWFNMTAPLARRGGLPPAGEPVAMAFVSALEVAGDNIAIARDLLLGLHQQLRGGGLDWLAYAVTRDSGFERAAEPFGQWRLPLSLMAITPAGTPLNNHDFRTQRPGFDPVLL